VTILFNVPRNDALARFWTDYVNSWTAWNHVRTVAALTAAALITIALCMQGVR
jgi:uncharacterized membrane protein